MQELLLFPFDFFALSPNAISRSLNTVTKCYDADIVYT